MLNHCLLSVDYSDEWTRVQEYLPSMCRLLDIKRLTLIYVVEVFRRPTVEDSKEAALRRLEIFASSLQEDLGITVDCKVRAGLAASETLKAAEAMQADGVITLNRSHSVGHEIFLGNTALNLARMTQVPLLILPFDGDVSASDGPLVLAYDGSKDAEAARRQFLTLIEAGASGIVVSVTDPEYGPEPTEGGTEIDSIGASHERIQVRRLTGRPVAEILATAEDERAPLIILGKLGHTAITALPLGSTAQGVARRTRRPVLLVPRQRVM